MRVTESRMMEQAAAAIDKARERAADAGNQLSGGIRVERPSQDEAGWSEGARAAARTLMSQSRGSAVGRARDHLQATDSALGGIGGLLSEVNAFAVQMANGTISAQDRANGANHIRMLRDAVIAAANTQDGNGEYVLAGTRSDVAPFQASGAYVGNTAERSMESAEGLSQSVSVSGSVLTAAGGVDVVGTLNNLADALSTNDIPGIEATLGDVTKAVDQVASARTQVGMRLDALSAADDARQELEQRLAERHSRAVEADPVAAASDLARSQQALAAAQVVAQQIADLTRVR